MNLLNLPLEQLLALPPQRPNLLAAVAQLGLALRAPEFPERRRERRDRSTIVVSPARSFNDRSEPVPALSPAWQAVVDHVFAGVIAERAAAAPAVPAPVAARWPLAPAPATLPPPPPIVRLPGLPDVAPSQALRIPVQPVPMVYRPMPPPPPLVSMPAPPAPSRAEYRVAVIGSRSFSDFRKMSAELDALFERLRPLHSSIIMVSGGAQGADSLAKSYAKVRGIRLIEMMADWRTHGKSAGMIRNRQLIASVHEVVAFWDGVSPGTRMALDLAKNRQLPVQIVGFGSMGPSARLPEPPKSQQGPNDITRILDLPRVPADAMYDAEAMTIKLKRAGVKIEDLKPGPLLPIQARALSEFTAANGGIGAMGVGSGKTLVTFLQPVLLESKVAILFVPPHLYRKTVAAYMELRLSWTLLPLGDFRKPAISGLDLGESAVFYIISLGQLSVGANSDLLDRIQADLVLVDEAHALRGEKSARSKRFKRFFDRHPETRAVFLSGTITNSKLQDYWHLCRWALGAGSPLPLSQHTTAAFDAAFGIKNDSEMYAEAAARDKEAPDLKYVQDIRDRYMRWAGKDATDPQNAFALRLTSTPGFVATNSASDDGNALTIVEQSCAIPPAVAQAVAELEDTWCTPGGEEIESQLVFEMHARTLSCGFYNVWRWPNNTPDKEWLEARRNWHRAVRQFLKKNIEKMDSPMLVERACHRRDERMIAFNAELDAEAVVPMMTVYEQWSRVKHRPEPDVDSVWIEKFLIDDVAALAARTAPDVIIWYDNPAVGAALAQATGYPLFGPGDKASQDLIALARKVLDRKCKPVPIICSIRCQGTGKDLQGWSQAIVAQVSANGSESEQLLGRLHRKGQRADEVIFHFYLHSQWARDAVNKAKKECEYQQKTVLSPQKLCVADFVSAGDLL